MASNYKFSSEEIAAIKAARRETKDKRADARLKALELRAEGMKSSEVAQATGFHPAYVTTLVAKYRDKGLEAISGNRYGGNQGCIPTGGRPLHWHQPDLLCSAPPWLAKGYAS